MISRWTLLGVMVLCASGAMSQERPDQQTKEPRDWLNGVRLVFRSGEAMLVRDASITLDEQHLGDRWRQAIRKLFWYFDHDADGKLAEEEARRIPSEIEMRRILWGNLYPPDGIQDSWATWDKNNDGELTLAEVESRYQDLGISITVGFGQSPNASPLNDAFRTQLDVNQDGKVSAREVEALVGLLDQVDVNGDEWLSPEELLPGTAYPGTAGTTRMVIDRSDHNVPSDRTCSVSVLTAGQHSNGAQKPSHGIWNVHIQENGVPLSIERSPAILPDKGNASAIHLSAWHDEGRLKSKLMRYRERLRTRFAEAADRELDSRRSTPEIFITGDNLALAEYPILSQLLVVGDRNGDQRLETAEVEAWLDYVDSLVQAQVLITVLDSGKGLFDVLDVDHNGLLSLRELRTAPRRLRKTGLITDKGLSWEHIPHSFSVIISRGHPRRLTAPASGNPPNWFRGMDRNGDGDISTREFLADAALFQMLDTNHDGLLSPQEATLAIKHSAPKDSPASR